MTLPPASSLGIKWTHWRRSLTWKNIKFNWYLVLNLSRCKLGTTENWCLTGLICKMKVFSEALPHLPLGTLKRKTKIADNTLSVSHSHEHLHLNEPKPSNWRTYLRERSLGTQTLGLHLAFLWPKTVLDKNDWVLLFWVANWRQYKWTPFLCPFTLPASTQLSSSPNSLSIHPSANLFLHSFWLVQNLI